MWRIFYKSPCAIEKKFLTSGLSELVAFAVKANPNRFAFQQVVCLLVLTM